MPAPEKFDHDLDQRIASKVDESLPSRHRRQCLDRRTRRRDRGYRASRLRLGGATDCLLDDAHSGTRLHDHSYLLGQGIHRDEQRDRE